MLAGGGVVNVVVRESERVGTEEEEATRKMATAETYVLAGKSA